MIKGKLFKLKIIFKSGVCHVWDDVVEVNILENYIELTYIMHPYSRDAIVRDCRYKKDDVKNLKIEWR